jgi:hypothetical protein
MCDLRRRRHHRCHRPHRHLHYRGIIVVVIIIVIVVASSSSYHQISIKISASFGVERRRSTRRLLAQVLRQSLARRVAP